MKTRQVTWHTNKEIVVVRATQNLVNWVRAKGFEMIAAQTAATPGYFLVDSPGTQHSSPDVPFVPRDLRNKIMLSWFSRVFESELAEMGLPTEAWPDTSCVETFMSFFSVEHHPLIADFGTQSLKTTMQPT